MTGRYLRRQLAAGLLLLLAAGCGSTLPSRFYTLAPVAPPPEIGQKSRLVIGLGPVVLPEYLNRPDIVTRAGETRMQLAELDRWVEPLEPLLTRVLAENLQRALNARDVVPVPQRRDVQLDRVVEVDVARFDADERGWVVLDARWRIYGRDGEDLLKSDRSVAMVQGPPPPDYDGIVAAMSRAVARLAQEIAAAITDGRQRRA